jgi:hypothetical protein
MMRPIVLLFAVVMTTCATQASEPSYYQLPGQYRYLPPDPYSSTYDTAPDIRGNRDWNDGAYYRDLQQWRDDRDRDERLDRLEAGTE